jgi:hypothetical protein
MSELAISQHTKLANGGADFAALANQGLSHVWLWDLGPPKPELPKRPEAPSGKENDPKYDLAMIDFREAIVDYEIALKAYRQAKIEYDDFAKRYGGPYEIRFWSADAQDALANDARAVKEKRQSAPRYAVSSRTRGHEKLKNGGLPATMKPGHGHAENLRRMAEGEADLAEAKRRDPVFGEQEMRP